MESRIVPGLSPQEIVESLGSEVLHELAMRLTLLGERVVQTRASGVLTIKLKVEPYPGSDVGFTVKEEFSVREPKQEPHPSVFITVGDGQLHRSDPRQQTLFDTRPSPETGTELRVVEERPSIVREVG